MEDACNQCCYHYNDDSTCHLPIPWKISKLPSTDLTSGENEKFDVRAFMLGISELISTDNDDDSKNLSEEPSEKTLFTEKICFNDEWQKMKHASSKSYHYQLPYQHIMSPIGTHHANQTHDFHY